jgi:hypothetical protein
MSLRISEPLVGQAVAFAVRAIQQAREDRLEIDKTPRDFQRRDGTDLHQPITPSIVWLITLHHTVYYPRLSRALKGERPWESEETLYLAYDCMKTAYLVDRLMLEELKGFAEMLEETTGEKREYAAILEARDSYQFLVLDWCDFIYGMIKQEIVWDEAEGSLCYDHSTQPRHKGIVQDACEELYNDWRMGLEHAVPNNEYFQRGHRLCQGNY